ncbi:iron-containing redox enzyme family protein [Halomonas sp. Bachu 37]|uniref:iron-containing redox enzyme family protein n=1 Tax=Halomonas kashgarensis TaxID=3084920 RepID=UPI0032172505
MISYLLQDKPAAAPPGSAKSVYHSMLNEPLAQQNRQLSYEFLLSQLDEASRLPCDMPSRPHVLGDWLERETAETGAQYAAYLDQRRQGQPRRYFTCRAHALTFLQRVAPTKLVDGAWLYGVLPNWADERFHPLIRTYLEELGDGEPSQNHVVLYRRLLARYGCDILPEMSDEHYTQGALQLSLAYQADRFLPELIGYNLGYEKLPLHLLITAFELDELGIDPYYFSLHVTIDNASTGHARRAMQSVLNMLPEDSDPQRFMARVANGYRLNELGLGATDIIETFDLEKELVAMLKHKSVFGRYVHSDYKRIGNLTINEWLNDPELIEDFLQVMQETGLIKRHQDPQSSPFWKLIDDSKKPPMYGVFSPSEKQLLYDWIAGDWLDHGKDVHVVDVETRSEPGSATPFRHHRAAGSPLRVPASQQQERPKDLDRSVEFKKEELRQLPEATRIEYLIDLMGPSQHATAAGLAATQIFSASVP